MIPGPNYVYECPVCHTLTEKGSLASGNTFGAKYYSDLTRIAPFLPYFPNIVCCDVCDTIFRLDDKNFVFQHEENNDEQLTDTKISKAQFMSIDNYSRAIDEGHAKTAEEEKEFRMNIWWLFNDRVKNGNQLFYSNNDKVRYVENAQKLIELLNCNGDYETIMIAELYRNLGQFEKCIDILNTTSLHADFQNYVTLIKAQCILKNSVTVEIL